MGNKIIGTGSALPEYVLTNDKLSQMVETNDAWITERTGIKTRHIVTHESTMELAKDSALKAIESAGIDKQEIDLIIVATISSDTLVPSAASYLQRDLGIKSCVSFDVNANCSGFLFALWTANSLMNTNNYNKALILGVERLSKIVNWEDRSTCILLGDGAGAAVLSKEETGGILSGNLNSVPDEKGLLSCSDTNKEIPFVESEPLKSMFYMNGQEVFKFASLIMLDEVKKVTAAANKTLDDISMIIPHQANVRIIDYASKKLGVDMDRFYVNVDKVGNTSSASVPMALDEFVRMKNPKKGDIIVLVGFGGGLTSGSVLIEW